MRKTAGVGDIVKFVDLDGKSFFTKVISFQTLDTGGIGVVLELRDGRVGTVEWVKVKWNGKQFIYVAE